AQLNQPSITLVKGTPYTLTFSARSDQDVTLGVALQQPHGTFRIVEQNTYRLHPQWREFKLQFFAGVNDPNMRVNFNGFGTRLAVVHLADVRFTAGGRVGMPLPDESLEAGTVNLPRP